MTGSSLAVVGIDPGGTIGYGLVLRDPSGTVMKTGKAFTDIVDAWNEVAELGRTWEHKGRILVIIEDFIGGGRMSADGQKTLKQIGFITGLCKAFEIECRVMAPQSRTSGMDEARSLLQEQKIEAKHYPHARDGLAHALVGYNMEMGIT